MGTPMRRFIALTAACGLAFASSGCDAKTQKAFHAEVARHCYVTKVGPTVVASVVASSAPSGGPSALHALCTDQAWRMLVTNECGTSERIPSMFEVPDPARRVTIDTFGGNHTVVHIDLR